MKIFHDKENSVMFTFIHNDIQTKKITNPSHSDTAS